MLTAVGVRNAKPREKAFKLSGERGLYQLAEPAPLGRRPRGAAAAHAREQLPGCRASDHAGSPIGPSCCPPLRVSVCEADALVSEIGGELGMQFEVSCEFADIAGCPAKRGSLSHCNKWIYLRS